MPDTLGSAGSATLPTVPVASPSPTRAVRLLASAAPALFTLAWLGLGAVTPGYSQAAGTISELAEVGALTAGAMTTALAVLGTGQLAGAVLAWRRPRVTAVAASLVLAGIGTLGVGALPLPGAGGPEWLATAHVAAAAVAFGGLHLAALTGALSPALSRRLRVAGAVSLAVALPHLVQFVSGLGGPGTAAGYLEKAFTTVLLAWCAAVAWRVDAG
jgi:hypothetical membrane protein